MHDIQLIAAIALWFGILGVLGNHFRKDKNRVPNTAWVLIAGVPAYLTICWFGMLDARANDAVIWGRLMSGRPSALFGVSSAALIASTAIALVAWSWDGVFSKKSKNRHLIAAIGPAVVWWVIWQHPVPHYVPMEEWMDDTVWALIFIAVIVGTALAPKFLPSITNLAPFAFWGSALLVLVLGIPLAVFAHWQAGLKIDLREVPPVERFSAMGCLSCHSLNGEGYAEPGKELEGGCSRSRGALVDFLSKPTKKMAEELGIRSPATGEMAGVRLTEDEVEFLADAMNEICPEPLKIEMPQTVQAAFTRLACVACHTLQGEGAHNGGSGGPLDESGLRGADVLHAWFKEPTADNAKKLGIRETATGQMAFMLLTDEERDAVVNYLIELSGQASSQKRTD